MSNLTSFYSLEELKTHGKRVVTPYSTYVRYAQKVVAIAEKVGAYALFIPEILRPYTLQTVSLHEQKKKRWTDG